MELGNATTGKWCLSTNVNEVIGNIVFFLVKFCLLNTLFKLNLK